MPFHKISMFSMEIQEAKKIHLVTITVKIKMFLHKEVNPIVLFSFAMIPKRGLTNNSYTGQPEAAGPSLKIYRNKCTCRYADLNIVVVCTCTTYGHLICTFISENQGLDKLRSVSNLRKISGPAHLNFFSVDLSFFFSLSPEFFQVYGINLKKIQVKN